MKRSAGMTVIMVAGLLAGCVDRGAEPMAPEAEGVTAVSGSASVMEGDGWIVQFKGKGPGDLSAEVEALGGRVDFVVESVGFAVVSGLTDETAAALGSRSGIASVFADVPAQLEGAPAMSGMQSLEVGTASIANPAGSFRSSYQWNMRVVGADVAWAAGHLGSPDVTIAILDSGIDYDSFDMNGMVDLDRSVSFVANDNAIINAFLPGRHPIDDMNGHGTNVATQASSNATIFAGVNSRARLMGVKVLGYNGSGSLGGILAGIVWAADNGADVANMSLGIRFGLDKAGNGTFMGLTNQVFNYAHRKGMVIVVAAGNELEDMDNNGRVFHAYCEASHVICVSATGPMASTNPFSGPWSDVDSFASYSNFGRQAVTLSAPGGTGSGYVSSVCARHWIGGVTNRVPVFPCDVPPGFFITFGYAGTSQAAPHVAGTVAQMIAKYGKMNPSQIKQMLLQSVDDLGPVGDDPQFGAGRVNVAKALGM